MTKSSVSVAVLIAPGCHPNTGSPRASRGDAVAMALGHSLSGSALRVVHAGSPSDPALQDYLALGAGTIEVLPCGDDQNAVAAIAAYLSDVDVIVTGMRSELGAGSGLLPYQLAHALARPSVSNVLEAHISSSAVSGWEMEIRQFLPKGKRRRIAASLPVVIAVNSLAPVSMGYAHARRVTGKILAVPVPLTTIADALRYVVIS